MKRKLLTDIELRAHWSCDRSECYYVEDDVILTPAAMDFVREHGITLCRKERSSNRGMSMTPVPVRNGKPVYQDAVTGAQLLCKSETMTHLRGNLLVPKTHPQIELRGRLDSLMAQIMQVQLVAKEEGQNAIVSDLEELLLFARKILASEVKDEPLSDVTMLGMDSQQIRYNSQQVKKVFGIDHPIPNYQMGRMCVELNRLRTQVREVELCAARAFYCDGSFTRPDLIEALNRMSSCVYIILCRKLSGFYDRGYHL